MNIYAKMDEYASGIWVKALIEYQSTLKLGGLILGVGSTMNDDPLGIAIGAIAYMAGETGNYVGRIILEESISDLEREVEKLKNLQIEQKCD